MNQRILVHLLAYVRTADREDAPPQVTQQGIAEALRARRSHVTFALQTLAGRGLVVCRTARIQGGARRKQAYALTPLGYERALESRATFASIPAPLPTATPGIAERAPGPALGTPGLADLLPTVAPMAGEPRSA